MTSDSTAADARALMRVADTATLATAGRDPAGWPHASLVLVALDHDASPILLLSDLAEHSKNAAGDDRVSLLFDGTAGLAERLTGPRLGVRGAHREDRRAAPPRAVRPDRPCVAV